jgi:hypothetical protein
MFEPRLKTLRFERESYLDWFDRLPPVVDELLESRADAQVEFVPGSNREFFAR